MNIAKIQTDAVKLWLKNKQKGKVMNSIWGRWDGKLVISPDGKGYVLYVIDEEDNAINPSKIGDMVWNLEVIFGREGYRDVTEVSYKDEEKRCRAFKTDSGTVYADDKMFAAFTDNVTYKARTAVDPVMVYENGALCGVVMPVVFADDAAKQSEAPKKDEAAKQAPAKTEGKPQEAPKQAHSEEKGTGAVNCTEKEEEPVDEAKFDEPETDDGEYYTLPKAERGEFYESDDIMF
ncbi:MAG: hypothetical protein K5981_09400 [Clostridia bacterium]|nr:hypothetical protein [Clostridia bacterium]